LKFLFLTI